MPAAIYTVGKTAIRDLLKTGFSPSIGVSDDNIAFNVAQTSINPTGGATTALVKTATIADVDASTYDATISINGTTEMTGKNIYSIGACTSNAASAAKSRTVRSNPIGVQTGDLYTIGLRIGTADNS